MTVPTYIPTYSEHQRTRSVALPSGEAFNYRKLRIRDDLVDALIQMKPSTKTLTAYLNSVLESFIAERR